MYICGYDTETWSSNQISKGLDHYFSADDFAIICSATADGSGIHTTDVQGELHPREYGWIHAAHNMPFDRRANERYYGLKDSVIWFDTMVGVRAILGASAGRSGYMSLDKSAKLLLPQEFHKDAAGADLMPYFSFPSPKNDFGRISWQQMKERHPIKWEEYKHYCGQDANVAFHLAMLTESYLGKEAFERLVYEAEITYKMNRRGWPVDEHLLQVMADRAQENTSKSLDSLIEDYNPGWSTTKKNGDELFKPLNLNSAVQLRKWLAEHDIVIDNAQADTITETIEMVEDNLDLRPDWAEVLAVLQTKVDLGGATLKKLEPLLKGMGADGRYRDAYNHIAASATHRTTSSGVQFQNMKRLPDIVEDLTEKMIASWNNGELAKNIRQLFMAEDPDGQIIVADLKSIEGLLVGWVFGVDWMVDAVRDGKDMYSMNATKRFGVPYESVQPAQRRLSKTGVLMGNYGGSVGAYLRQSPGSTEEEARTNVRAYRDTVPNLVQAWWDLNDMLIECVEEGQSGLRLYNGYNVTCSMIGQLGELTDPTLEVCLNFQGKPIFARLWHGVRIEEDGEGRKEITYAVAEEKKTATTMWKRLTSDGQKFRLYGGKLTGTLIQSLARELYFYQLTQLQSVMGGSSTQIIGQLHDEVVCEWKPGGFGLDRVERVIEEKMTLVPWYLAACPVRVKVSHARRYIK